MIKKALLLASVLCVLNQTPVKAETYVEPYSHVTIEITEDYASSNDSFGSIELSGKASLRFTPEEDVRAPSRSVVDWFHAYDSQGRAITMDMYNPKDTSVDLDYSIMGVSGDTSPANLSTLLGEPSNKNTYSGVTDISWESGKQERSVDIRYEAGVIKNIAAEVRTPEEVFDYPYYDEVGLFNLTGDSYESSVPFKLPTVAVVILLVGVTVLKKYGEEGDE